MRIEVPRNWNLVVSCQTDVTSFDSRRGDNSRLNRVVKQYVTKNLNVVTDFGELIIDLICKLLPTSSWCLRFSLAADFSGCSSYCYFQGRFIINAAVFRFSLP